MEKINEEGKILLRIVTHLTILIFLLELPLILLLWNGTGVQLSLGIGAAIFLMDIVFFSGPVSMPVRGLDSKIIIATEACVSIGIALSLITYVIDTECLTFIGVTIIVCLRYTLLYFVIKSLIRGVRNNEGN